MDNNAIVTAAQIIAIYAAVKQLGACRLSRIPQMFRNFATLILSQGQGHDGDNFDMFVLPHRELTAQQTSA